MKAIRILSALALLVCAPAGFAQYVKGNEAIQTLANGGKVVTTPPIAGTLLGAPCPAANPACSGAGWKMVETPAGLLECTEIYARPTTCRASTYGSQKLPRVWIVKTKGAWSQCPQPDLNAACVSVKSLPNPLVQ